MLQCNTPLFKGLLISDRPTDRFDFLQKHLAVYWALFLLANQKRPFVPFRQTEKTLELDRPSVTSI